MSSYKETRVFATQEVLLFLRAMDRHLSERACIIIVGGSAAVFYDAESTTNDIDTYTLVDDALKAAADAAVAETGLAIPVQRSTVGDYPWNFEDRLQRPIPELEKLDVCVLERHDLVLSKTVRGDDHDEQQIADMHLAEPFSFDILVERFRSEMTHAMGSPARLRDQFLQLIRRLFGELKRLAAERALRS